MQMNERRHITAVTATPLTAQSLQKLRAVCKRRYGENYTLECLQDQELIGGMQIFDGERMIDGSIRGKLHTIHDALLKAQTDAKQGETSHGA